MPLPLFRIVEDRDPSRTLVVLNTGEINFPYIGRVKAVGKTCRELASTIKPLLETDNYHQATIILGLDTQMRVRSKAYLFGGAPHMGPSTSPAMQSSSSVKPSSAPAASPPVPIAPPSASSAAPNVQMA